MEFMEVSPLPEVCKHCTEPECDVCDHGLDRWIPLPEREHGQKDSIRKPVYKLGGMAP